MASCKYLLSAFGGGRPDTNTDTDTDTDSSSPQTKIQSQTDNNMGSGGGRMGAGKGTLQWDRAMWRHWTLLCFIGQVRYKVQIVEIVFDLCRRTPEMKYLHRMNELKYIRNYYR